MGCRQGSQSRQPSLSGYRKPWRRTGPASWVTGFGSLRLITACPRFNQIGYNRRLLSGAGSSRGIAVPIYEYQCQSCGHQMEALQKISDEPLKDCPVCHKPELSKLISAASFRLKGGGWYETDFKTGGKKQLAESDSATKSSGDEAKAESKDSKTAKPAASGEKGKSSPDKGSKDQSNKPKKAD